MRILILLFFFPLFTFSQEKEQQEDRPVGIGFRIGDFNGLTVKYYLEDADICLEANVGRSYFSGDNYEKRFEIYAKDEGIEYVSYDPKRTVELGSFGYRIDIQKYGRIGNTPHFYWYGGTGFQFRTFTISHSYSYLVSPKNSTAVRINDAGKIEIKHKSYGIDLMIGGEYVFQEIPVSIFVDGLLFYEAFGLRANIIGQFGLGGRFHF